MDKFKGSLSAKQACEAVILGIKSVDLDWNIVVQPLADGGEGTAEILTNAHGGVFIEMLTENPLGKPIMAKYGFVPSIYTAYIDMAEASGLCLLAPAECNPLFTSTYGTGLMLRHAIANGAKHIVLCVGGSATNDGGAGMAAAFGYRFLDKNKKDIRPNGSNLAEITHIMMPTDVTNLRQMTITVATDVNNPLCGPNGAAFVYGPQKGASPEDIWLLDHNLRHLADLVKHLVDKDLSETPGAGAAGGMGFGAMAFLDARLRSGIELVICDTALEDHIMACDIIITGEGKLDSQTMHGKTVAGVAALATKHSKPVFALCGTLDLDESGIRQLGLTKVESILRPGISSATAMDEAYSLLQALASNLIRTQRNETDLN